jgi:hypothetical protein
LTLAMRKKGEILNHMVAAGELEMFTHNMARIIASKVPVVKEQLRILADADPIAPNVLVQI